MNGFTEVYKSKELMTLLLDTVTNRSLRSGSMIFITASVFLHHRPECVSWYRPPKPLLYIDIISYMTLIVFHCLFPLITGLWHSLLKSFELYVNLLLLRHSFFAFLSSISSLVHSIQIPILIGKKRNVYRLLVEKPEGKRPLGRPRRRWIDNIKMDFLEIGVNVVDWIGLA
jgi:hypothetical protein